MKQINNKKMEFGRLVIFASFPRRPPSIRMCDTLLLLVYYITSESGPFSLLQQHQQPNVRIFCDEKLCLLFRCDSVIFSVSTRAPRKGDTLCGICDWPLDEALGTNLIADDFRLWCDLLPPWQYPRSTQLVANSDRTLNMWSTFLCASFWHTMSSTHCRSMASKP